MPLMSDSLRNLASSLTVAALIIAGLVLGRDVLIPLTLAALIAFVLSPVVRALTSWRFPRAAAVLATVTMVTAGLAGFSGLVSNELLGLTGELSTYKANVISKVRAVTGAATSGGTIAKATAAVESLGNDLQKEMSGQPSTPSPRATGVQTQQTEAPPAVVVAAPPPPALKNPVVEFLSAFGQPMAQIALTFLFAIFLLLQYQDLRDRIVRIVGTDHMSDTTSAMSEAGSRLSQLFMMQALLNGAFGLFVGVALWGIGVPNAALWGVLAAVMRFVPYIGSLIAAVPPVLLAAAVDPGWSMFFATLAVFVIGEPVMGHAVEPMLLGKKAGISPFAMVASASFWTLLWGPVGLILAAPLTMGLIVLGRYVDGLAFFSILLGDDPPLSSEQVFYHRLLSDDPVSAIETFETAIDDTTLSAAVDDLVLPALTLAAYDNRAGRLDRDQIGNVTKTMTALRDSLPRLPDDADVDAGSSANQRRVLVFAARGAIDEAAAAFAASAISSSANTLVPLASDASGLTALGGAHALAGNEGVDAIVIVSVGGAERTQLRFIAKRAQREFPGVATYILEHHRNDGIRHANSVADEEDVRTLRRLADVIAQVKSAPRLKPDSVKSNPALRHPDRQLVPSPAA